MRIHCETCDSMVPADDVHSCYDAARLTQHRDAERAVIEAAKAMADLFPISTSYSEWLLVRDGLLAAVANLRKQEGA